MRPPAPFLLDGPQENVSATGSFQVEEDGSRQEMSNSPAWPSQASAGKGPSRPSKGPPVPGLPPVEASPAGERPVRRGPALSSVSGLLPGGLIRCGAGAGARHLPVMELQPSTPRWARWGLKAGTEPPEPPGEQMSVAIGETGCERRNHPASRKEARVGSPSLVTRRRQESRGAR